MIKSKGLKVGIALNPLTDVENIYDFIDMIDRVLVMSVDPGFSGQKFDKNIDETIKQVIKSSKNENNNLNLGLQNGLGFLRFLLLKSTLGGALGPSGRPNRKSPPKLAKKHPSYVKMTLK